MMKKGITRREFMKGAAAGAAGITALGLLNGCSSSNSPAPSAASSPETTTAAASDASPDPSKEKKITFSPGTYEGNAVGKKGNVKVSVTFSSDAIENIEILESLETEDLSYLPLHVLPQKILAAQSLAVDTVSGATFSSLALINAVADAAEAAGASGDLTEAEPAAIEITQAMKPGTYVGEAYGNWKKGSIEGERHGCPAKILPTQVQVKVSETAIESVEVLDCSDTPGFKDPAIEKIPAAIVEKQSLFVDTIAGATMTSAAILSAAAKALEEAGANLVGFSAREEKVTAQETLNADVAIIGAGLSGTAAALKALDEGLTVVIIEKTGRISGCGACATGPFAVGSKFQKEAGLTLSVDKVFTDMMDYSYWKTNAPLVYDVIANSGRMIDWMQEKWESVGQPGFVAGPKSDGINQMHTFGKGTAKFQALYDGIILPSGGTLLLETTAKELIMENGKAAGVKAVKKDGTEVTVNAPSVVIATGGFGGNAGMMETYLGSSHFGLVGLSSSTGDGIQAALDAGASLSNEISPHLAEFCNNDHLDYYAGYMKFINQAGFLMLDPAGARFMNEAFCVTHSNTKGAAAMRRADYSFIIFTQKDLDSMVEKGLWEVVGEDLIKELEYRSRIIVPAYYTLYDEMEEAIAHNQAWKADTLEELGEAVGFDPETYTKAIADYREVLATGVDPLYGKRPEFLHPLSEGPFYAVRIISPIDGTFNGIRINNKMQALDKDQKPIGGLYVTGMDAGGFFTYPYNEYLGSTSGFSLISGMLAAEHIKEYLGK